MAAIDPVKRQPIEGITNDGERGLGCETMSPIRPPNPECDLGSAVSLHQKQGHTTDEDPLRSNAYRPRDLRSVILVERLDPPYGRPPRIGVRDPDNPGSHFGITGQLLYLGGILLTKSIEDKSLCGYRRRPHLILLPAILATRSNRWKRKASTCEHTVSSRASMSIGISPGRAVTAARRSQSCLG